MNHVIASAGHAREESSNRTTVIEPATLGELVISMTIHLDRVALTARLAQELRHPHALIARQNPNADQNL